MVLLMAVIVIESHLRLLIWRKKGLQSLSWQTRLLYTAPALFPAWTILLPRYRLSAFYLAYLLLCILQERAIPTRQQQFNCAVRMRFVMFGCLHMTMLGLLSLILVHCSHTALVGREVMLPATMMLALLISAAVKFAALLPRRYVDFQVTPEERRDFRHLYWFLNLTVAYLFIQTLLCQFQFPVDIHLTALLCSNLITLCYISCYFISLMEILRKFHVQNSYYTLSASLIESDQRLRHLRSNAHYDALTGARSRGYVLQALRQMIRMRTPFSLIYLDLNGLKHINDTQGHPAGDTYLRRFVEAVQHQTRDGDILARYGGDEFLLVLRRCSKANAEKRLEVMRQRITQETDEFGFGAGVVESGEAPDLDGLLLLADQRMYGDKKRKGAPDQ